MRLGAAPDHFNAGGLLLGLLSGLLIASGRVEAGGWAIALAGVCDILDGRVARARKLASPYGKFIDSTLDRFVETFAFLGFAWLPARDALRRAPRRGRPRRVAPRQLRAGARGDRRRLGLGRPHAAGGAPRAADPRLPVRPGYGGALGRPEGTILLWVLGVTAVGAFATAIYRTAWIARKLKG